MRIMLTMANIVLIIISNIGHTVYIRFQAVWNFSKLHFALHIWVLRNFYCGDAHHAIYGKHSLNNHFQHCPHCIGDLQCFQTFQNGRYFFTSWLLRNFYYGDAHHANYGKHSWNNHFQHCSDCVWEIYRVFKVFEIAVFLHLLAFTKFLLWWCASC